MQIIFLISTLLLTFYFLCRSLSNMYNLIIALSLYYFCILFIGNVMLGFLRTQDRKKVLDFTKKSLDLTPRTRRLLKARGNNTCFARDFVTGTIEYAVILDTGCLHYSLFFLIVMVVFQAVHKWCLHTASSWYLNLQVASLYVLCFSFLKEPYSLVL